MAAPRILLSDCSQNRNQWLALREGKVSGSIIPTIAGLNPYKSPLELWAEWTGKVQDTFQGNDATRLGLVLEPYVADLYARRTGKQVIHADALYQHAELDWAVATPDYIVNEPEPFLLEIKTGSPRTAYKWQGGGAPDNYVAQLTWQLGVMGMGYGELCPFLGLEQVEGVGDVPVPFDAQFFSALVEVAEQFLDQVKKDIPPEAGAGDAQILKQLVKTRSESVQVLRGDEAEAARVLITEVIHIAARIKPVKEQLEALEEQKKHAENKLKQMAGECIEVQLDEAPAYKVSRIEVKERTQSAYTFDRIYIAKGMK